MVIPDFLFYSSLLAWLVFCIFLGTITRKIGILVVPLALVFGGYIFSLEVKEGKCVSALVFWYKSLTGTVGWMEIALIPFLIIAYWIAGWAMDKASGNR
ncbi:hypothetical protein AGJ34_20430 [Cronobacter dublinensis subsp. dublinensis]|nr:hypothetical protein [Cronobacter dublinensis subsp. dublinensis]EGT5729673.1 hypothetical protein [Cronobacter dublinensis subsp. dublinensis]